MLGEEASLCLCCVAAGVPRHIAVGVSDWQKRSALRQPHPVPQSGTFAFEALSIVLLGLEGKITLVEVVRAENLAAV